ncbi:hypothetical protein [Roseomonas populi]|uniref:Glycosyltransferase RgtA/B/C/D-like domain-containing protein n=1 Tax=Roseomonas populi TaxID=3121582 RepID=A0ABT1X1N4_9PROT|nr:hypothetical protein [Roseomonas pecuniae]MCR0982011.1 hypothetical protein [Roseomonas pecuniae]
MSLHPWLAPLRHSAVRLLLLLVAAGFVSVLRGQDNNWDLRNYHLYLPFSLLEGRLGMDIMPAGPQSAFNPLLDLPYYLLAVSWLPDRPRLVAFLAGLPYGLLAFLTLEICASLARGLPDLARPGRTAATAALIGVSGSTILSEIGTTYGDIPIGVLVLAGLLVPLRALEGAGGDAGWRRASLAAGLCLGLAAGLKLTAALYAPALLIGAVVASRAAGLGWRPVLTGALLLCIGWGAAFAASWGWWGWAVFQRYGNPLFPFMNQVFASPWAAPVSLEDTRFLPRGPLQALAYPFFWLRGQSFVVAETSVADPRFALAWLAVVALGLRAAWNRAMRRPPILPPATILLVTFVAVAFALWEIQFSILRYVVALEALTGAVILAALSAFGWSRARRFLPGLVALLVLVVAVTEKQNWGRLRQYGARVIEVTAPALPDGAVVAVASRPTAFVLPFLTGRDLVFVGLGEVPPGTRQWEETRRLLHSGRPVQILRDPRQNDSAADLAAFGLVPDEARCAPVAANLRAGLQLCPARPV